QDKEQRMATLGAHLIRGNVNRNESEETARLRNSGETSALRKAVNAAESTLRLAYRFMALMVGADPDAVDVTLNRDFIESSLSGVELEKYVGAWQKGGLSDEEFVNIKKSGELTDPAKTTEEVIAEMEASLERRRANMPEPTATNGAQGMDGQQQPDGGQTPPVSEAA